MPKYPYHYDRKTKIYTCLHCSYTLTTWLGIKNHIRTCQPASVDTHPFGSENLTYLKTHDKWERYMDWCIRNHTTGVSHFIQKIHFDHIHPENRNLRMIHKRHVIECWNGSRWEAIDWLTLLDRYRKELMQFFKGDELDRFAQYVALPMGWITSSEEMPDKHLIKHYLNKLRHELIQHIKTGYALLNKNRRSNLVISSQQ